MRQVLVDELGQLPGFRDVRGRGLRFSLEYRMANNNEFGTRLAARLLEKYNILINAKWHRVCFTPGLILSRAQADEVLAACVSEFKSLAAS
jgi:4-aminobutyrate aminotransferase-like enzyme